MMPRMIIPKKDFSTSDPNRFHAVRCIVVMVPANDEEEALSTLALRHSELKKFALRLPSDISKYPELENFIRLEDIERRDMSIQSESADGSIQLNLSNLGKVNHPANPVSLVNKPKIDDPLFSSKNILNKTVPDSTVKEEINEPDEGTMGTAVKTTTVANRNNYAEKPKNRPLQKVIMLNDCEDEDESPYGTNIQDGNYISPKQMPNPVRKRSTNAMCKGVVMNEEEEKYAMKEEIASIDSMDDEDYSPYKKARRSSKKNFMKKVKNEDGEGSPSSPHVGDKTVLECVVCSSKIAMKGTNRGYLIQHGMTHCDQKRHKCTLCVYSSAVKTNVNRHMVAYHDGLLGDPIDTKNELREALWKEWMYKCFPDADKHSIRQILKKTSTNHSKCLICSEEIPADDGHLFSHIVSDHSDDNIDYDDPEGVKKRFFG